MQSKFRQFFSLPNTERKLFIEALWFQFTSGLLLKLVPFKYIPRLYPNPKPTTLNSEPSPLTPEPSPLTPHPLTLEQIKLSTQRAGLIVPWKNKCLVQSLAARRMMKRRSIISQLSLGVALGRDGKMTAHAWIKAGDFEVVERGGDFKELFIC